jgi:hypothetical protein
MDSSGVVKPRFSLTEGLVEVSLQEDQGDLDPFGEPAVAIRRSGFVWIVDVLFDNILTLSYGRTF